MLSRNRGWGWQGPRNAYSCFDLIILCRPNTELYAGCSCAGLPVSFKFTKCLPVGRSPRSFNRQLSDAARAASFDPIQLVLQQVAVIAVTRCQGLGGAQFVQDRNQMRARWIMPGMPVFSSAPGWHAVKTFIQTLTV